MSIVYKTSADTITINSEWFLALRKTYAACRLGEAGGRALAALRAKERNLCRGAAIERETNNTHTNNIYIYI